MAPERALPGSRHDRAPGPCTSPRPPGSRHGAGSAQAQKEKLSEGVSGLRILEDVGVKVHRLRHLKLRAKLLLADEQSAIVASINLAPGSFDSRRELAIEVNDPDVVGRLHQVVSHDWNNFRPLDLSDRDLLAELAKGDANLAEDLALPPARSRAGRLA